MRSISKAIISGDMAGVPPGLSVRLIACTSPEDFPCRSEFNYLIQLFTAGYPSGNMLAGNNESVSFFQKAF